MHQIDQVPEYPAGSRILHIGPPKTGTSSLQGALHLKRTELEGLGVLNAARTKHPRSVIGYVSFPKPPTSAPKDAAERWHDLASRFANEQSRLMVLSSETFSAARDDKLAGVVKDLGGQFQVVLTMRPLAKILPSRWQQFVQDGVVRDSYDDWLKRVLAPDDTADDYAKAAINRFRLDTLVKEWGAYVGEENVTVVMLDPANRAMLFDTFETMLGLPAGFLEDEPGSANLSLPYPEVEMLRAFNDIYKREDETRKDYMRYVFGPARAQIKAAGVPKMTKAPIPLPEWALGRANEIAEGIIEGVRATDAKVIGDLNHLISPASDATSAGAPETVSVKTAAEIAYAMYVAGRQAGVDRAKRKPVAPANTPEPPTPSLARRVARKIARRG